MNEPLNGPQRESIPEELASFDVIARPMWLRVANIEPVHVSMTKRSTIVTDCNRVSQPMMKGHAGDRFAF